MHPGSIPGEASNLPRFPRGRSNRDAAPTMTGLEGESDMRRQKLVDGQLRTGGVNDPAVLAAFLAGPREQFAQEAPLAVVYSDGALKARSGAAKLLPPLALARLVQALALKPGAKTLDVAGGGYSAALMRAMGAEVVEGGADAAHGGPFDAILLNGGFEAEPTALTALLAPGGRLAGFRCAPSGGHAVVIERSGHGALDEAAVFEGSAAVLPGFAKPAAFVF